MTTNTSRRPGSVVAVAAAACVVLFGPARTTPAHERYNSGCNDCHGEFTDGTSPKGTVFPRNDKHFMHRNVDWMATDCDLCHRDGDNRNPFIGMSNGTESNPGVGCTGCHGREYGGMSSGVGLRLHHFVNGVTECATCHPDDPHPLPESVKPVYYGTPDTRVDDPCNAAPGFLENWSIGDELGLDNDGDDAYDGADADCACDLPGDVDGDGDVDFQDLVGLLADWGCSGPECAGDVDGDGDTDFQDLVALLARWGETCP